MNTMQSEIDAAQVTRVGTIPEDRHRLLVLSRDAMMNDQGALVRSLKDDCVTLVQGLSPAEASELMLSAAKAFGLAESLDLQAAFASSLGHRENVGKYYMTVNKRRDYQFVCPHSEGSSFTNLQLASFYCYENSTDGGETILFNTNQLTELWTLLREKARRGKSARALTAGETRQLKMMMRLNMPEDTLKDDDEVLSESAINPDFSLYEVLAKPRKTYSHILQRDLYAFWTSIESTDLDSLNEFYQFLRHHGLLKIPPTEVDAEKLDDEEGNRIRHFGSDYHALFKSKLTHKLQAGEFIILNNLTWTHAVNNWNPHSGRRKVVAAFA